MSAPNLTRYGKFVAESSSNRLTPKMANVPYLESVVAHFKATGDARKARAEQLLAFAQALKGRPNTVFRRAGGRSRKNTRKNSRSKSRKNKQSRN